ncbi:hypothetical protein BGW38_002234 [Lunasporangiospora selenospora]|uniref:TspO/MBR related protein n=1 Tax=Lunasporangiospora selenospora TaxID=979761 RepID=A0A9P6G368_9FUNG|nr:hypothetical protein BGW38_002234 [Lunasporangiospora selenospora]
MAIQFHHEHWPSKVVNIIVYLTLLSGNLWSTFGGDHDQDSPYDSKHKSYITPASFTFFVWSLIHFLLGGMIIYQWFTTKVHEAIGWHFALITLFNAIWLALWSTGHTFLALLSLFIATSGVSYIYGHLKDHHHAESVPERLFLHLPFSLYHSWSYVLLVVNAFAVFSPTREDGPSTFQIVLAIAGLLFVGSAVIGFIEHKKGDVAGALVLAWYLFGVYAQQDEPAIHWTALALGIIASIYTLKPLALRLLNRQTPETAPLLG